MGKKKAAAPPEAPPIQKEPGKAGRPPIELDPQMVQALAERSLTQEDCAAVLGISIDTLQRRYLDAYNEGLQKCKASLRRKQFEMAQAGNVTMLIWLGKNMLGQADKHELTGADGKPLIPDVDREEILGKLIGSGPTPPKDRIH
jgi:hypothetical protein